jgi:prepilin-type N-terminal cleavage/methylation domain-containing protein
LEPEGESYPPSSTLPGINPEKRLILILGTILPMKRKPQTAGFTLIEILLVISILCVLSGIAVFSYSSSKIKAYDVAAQEDLRQAYSSAMAFFIDNPESTLTQNALREYGFRSSPNVRVSIIDGSSTSLFLLSRYNAPGGQAYITYSKGINSPGEPNQIWAAQWIPGGQSGSNPTAASPTNPSGQDGESGPKANSVNANLLEKCNLLTKSALGEAFGAAQSYFQSNPEGVLTKDLLAAYGYTPHDSVNLTIVDGSPDKLSMSAVSSLPGATNFGVDGSGNIIPQS